MSVIAALEALPTDGLTVKALTTLDFVVPGQWSNPTNFDQLIAEILGDANPAVIARVRQQALLLEAGPSATYDEALRIFQLVDTMDTAAAGVAVAAKVTGLFGGLGFLDAFTPKPETTQCIDAGVKLVAELVCFGLINGVPTTDADGLARFTGALADYGRNDLVRIAAWVVYDGLLPLGPDFVAKLVGTFRSAASNETLTNNPLFEQLSSRLPGDTALDKQAFIVRALDSTGDWITRFVEERGITREVVLAQLDGVLGIADGGVDYVAAAIDASTAYVSHTGTQSVARALARHATEDLKRQVWAEWMAAQA